MNDARLSRHAKQYGYYDDIGRSGPTKKRARGADSGTGEAN